MGGEGEKKFAMNDTSANSKIPERQPNKTNSTHRNRIRISWTRVDVSEGELTGTRYGVVIEWMMWRLLKLEESRTTPHWAPQSGNVDDHGGGALEAIVSGFFKFKANSNDYFN